MHPVPKSFKFTFSSGMHGQWEHYNLSSMPKKLLLYTLHIPDFCFLLGAGQVDIFLNKSLHPLHHCSQYIIIHLPHVNSAETTNSQEITALNWIRIVLSLTVLKGWQPDSSMRPLPMRYGMFLWDILLWDLHLWDVFLQGP